MWRLLFLEAVSPGDAAGWAGIVTAVISGGGFMWILRESRRNAEIREHDFTLIRDSLVKEIDRLSMAADRDDKRVTDLEEENRQLKRDLFHAEQQGGDAE